MNENTIAVGRTYQGYDSSAIYRILQVHPTGVLMEVWNEGSLTKYIVAVGIRFVGKYIDWEGARCFWCNNPPQTDTQAKAFERAIRHLLVLERVFIVKEDTAESDSITAHSTFRGAAEELQALIDGNDDLRAIAADYGYEPLTAEDIIGGALVDLPTDDSYFFHEIAIDERRQDSCIDRMRREGCGYGGH